MLKAKESMCVDKICVDLLLFFSIVLNFEIPSRLLVGQNKHYEGVTLGSGLL